MGLGRREARAHQQALAACGFLVAASGCVRETQLQGVLGLAPDGHNVLTEVGGELALFNLDTGSAAWEIAVERPPGFRGELLTWSANGAYFVLGEEAAPQPHDDARFTVWETSSGRRRGPAYAFPGRRQVGDHGLAVSDNGEWLASTRSSGGLQLFATGSGVVAFEVASDDATLPLAFSLDSSALVASGRRLDHGRPGWLTAPARFRKGHDAVWLGQRFAVATEQGVDIWQGDKALQHLPLTGRTRLVAGAHLLAIVEPLRAAGNRDEPGHERLVLFDVELNQTRFSCDDLGGDLQLVFRGDRLFVRGFDEHYALFVSELDLRSGATLHEMSFDRSGWDEGGSAHSLDERKPLLLPQARYLELPVDRASRSARFVALELH